MNDLENNIRSSQKVGETELGDIYMNTLTQSKCIVITKKFINKYKFKYMINQLLSLLDIKKVKFSIHKDKKLKIIGNKSEIRNLYFSKPFLNLCGYSQDQYDSLPNVKYNPTNLQYFNARYILNISPENTYCKLFDPPIFLDVFSSDIRENLHDYNSDTFTKICTINNTKQYYEVIQEFTTPLWYEASKICGGIIHLNVLESCKNTIYSPNKIKTLIFHLNVCHKDNIKIPKMIFCNLHCNNAQAVSKYTFTNKLSNSISIKNGDQVGLTCVRLPNFNSIFGEHMKFHLNLIYQNKTSEFKITMKKSIFTSNQSFINELNTVFQDYQIIFTLKDMSICIKNTSPDNMAILYCSEGMMKILGCYHDSIPKSININQRSKYFFDQPFDLFSLTPKILTFHVSFLCNVSTRDELYKRSHVIFFDNNEKDRVFHFNETFEHMPGIFNHIQVDVYNPLNHDYSFSDDSLHCCFVLKEHQEI